MSLRRRNGGPATHRGGVRLEAFPTAIALATSLRARIAAASGGSARARALLDQVHWARISRVAAAAARPSPRGSARCRRAADRSAGLVFDVRRRFAQGARSSAMRRSVWPGRTNAWAIVPARSGATRAWWRCGGGRPRLCGASYPNSGSRRSAATGHVRRTALPSSEKAPEITRGLSVRRRLSRQWPSARLGRRDLLDRNARQVAIDHDEVRQRAGGERLAPCPRTTRRLRHAYTRAGPPPP